MNFKPNFQTTHVGSMPHSRLDGLCQRLIDTLDIPAWPQLPRRIFRENMYTQYSAGLPGLVVDTPREKIFFDTTGDLTPALEAFYERYLADDVETFAMAPDRSVLASPSPIRICAPASTTKPWPMPSSRT
jgi:hypothetical protein